MRERWPAGSLWKGWTVWSREPWPCTASSGSTGSDHADSILDTRLVVGGVATVDKVAAPGALVPLRGGDLDVLTSDVGPAPANIGLLLELPNAGLDQASEIAKVLTDRTRAVPALGRAIHREGRRLYWSDRPQLTPYIRVLDVRGGGGALDRAARLLTTPLDLDTRPWAIDLLVSDHDVSVVFVAHHVLTDGLHGLSMLTALADSPGNPDTPTAGPAASRDTPQRSDRAPLARRRRGLHLAPRTSLNRPTGPDRGIATHDIALEAVRSAAHRAAATVNDVLLVSASQAMAAELDRRGEHPPRLMVWVPVATRPTGGRPAPDEVGNTLGVMLVPVDLRTALPHRLAQVSAFTKRRKASARNPANAQVAHLVSQASGRLGLAWTLNQRQRIGNTSLSTMRGPTEVLHLAGHPLRRIVPAGSRAANVGVSFLALSYAGTLTVSIVHDPAQLPDAAPMLADLATALDDLVRT